MVERGRRISQAAPTVEAIPAPPACKLAVSWQEQFRTGGFTESLSGLECITHYTDCPSRPMSSPTLNDDGTTVTLDLHGLSVDEALDVTFSTLRLAEDRGRSRLKVIHGSSTTQGQRRTIKSALHDQLDRGSLGAHATNVVRARDTLTLALDLTASSDPTPITLRDVRP